MANNNIRTLVEKAIRVYVREVSYFNKITQKTEKLSMSDFVDSFNFYYSTDRLIGGRKLVYFVKNNNIYMTPHCDQLIEFLNSSNFHNMSFCTSFLPCHLILWQKTQWKKLLKLADQFIQTYWQDYYYSKKSDKLNLGTLKNETLKNCFRIPDNGIKVKNPKPEYTYRIGNTLYVPPKRKWYIRTYYPVFCFCFRSSDEGWLDDKDLGKFYSKDNRVIFIYRDGSTYVAKGDWIVDELKSAGYSDDLSHHTHIPVSNIPFSKEEKICNIVLRHKWNSIRKK